MQSAVAAGLFAAGLALVLLFAATSSAQNALSKKADLQTYYLCIFSNPIAGKEDEYNKWYNEEHAPDVVSVPGFVSAQRLVFSDVQFSKTATPPKGVKYLVMYKIVTSDLASVYAEVRRRAMNGMTRMSTTLDSSTIFGYTYTAIRPVMDGTQPRGVEAGKIDSLPVYYQLAFADPEAETEYNKFYDEHHEPEILAAPGFVSGQRFIFSDLQMMKDTGPKYLAMFKIVASDLSSTFDELRLAPMKEASPAFKTSHTVGYTYKAIGPVIDGDKVRAERARAQ
jgi:hypothetical protein